MIARTIAFAALVIVSAATLLVAALAFASPAQAHTKWANGDPIPAWVKEECCSQAHAHHLADDAVHEMPDGYHIDGYQFVIPYSKALPSPDGSTWLFYRTYNDNSVSPPFCFFLTVRRDPDDDFPPHPRLPQQPRHRQREVGTHRSST